MPRSNDIGSKLHSKKLELTTLPVVTHVETNVPYPEATRLKLDRPVKVANYKTLMEWYQTYSEYELIEEYNWPNTTAQCKAVIRQMLGAAQGNLASLEFFVDRVDGKTVQKVQVEGLDAIEDTRKALALMIDGER